MNNSVFQVLVYQVKQFDGTLHWTVFPKKGDHKHIKDKFFITLHSDRDEVYSLEHAQETVEKWIGIRGLRNVPVHKIMHIFRNEFYWAPPLDN